MHPLRRSLINRILANQTTPFASLIIVIALVLIVGFDLTSTTAQTPATPPPGILERIYDKLCEISTKLPTPPLVPVPSTQPLPLPTTVPVPLPTTVPPPPTPSTIPPLTTTPIKVATPHPRLFSATSLPEKIAADPSTWKYVIASAEITTTTPTALQIAERMACSAALYRFGLVPGFTYKKSQADYGAQSVADFLAFNLAPANYTALDTQNVHLACTFDWCYPLLTPAQRQSFITQLASFRAAIKGIGTKGNSAQPGWELWWGYNQLAGGIMLLDLAVAGDSDDWVTDTYQNSWWANDPQKPNFYAMSRYFPRGTNREGFGYWAVGGCPTVEFAKIAFAQNTGDSLATDLNPNRYPLWNIWGMDPASFAVGKFPFILPTVTYTGAIQTERIWPERLGIQTGLADPSQAGLARWLLNQTVGWGAGASDSPLYALISYLLAGDPRVQPKSPTDLSLPLSFDTTSESFQRSDWTPSATVLYFGCAPYVTRTTPCNDLMLWSKGQALICQRQRIMSHSYGCGALRSMPLFYAGNQIVGQMPDDAALNYLLRGSLTHEGNTWVGDATRLYRNPNTITAPLPIQLARRSVTYQHPKIVVLDELQCDPSLTPHVVWNTPAEPTLNPDGSVTFSNPPASCTMTFDQTPKIIKIGGTDAAGVRHWDDGLDGQPMDVSGKPTSTPAIDGDLIRLAPADQLRGGGYWRIHIVPVGPTITTTILVN